MKIFFENMLFKLLLCTLMLPTILGCVREELKPVSESGDPASLSFMVSMPDVVQTKGYADADFDNVDNWSEWDRLVDGQMFYRLTIFIVDRNGRLVAYRDLEQNCDDWRAEGSTEGANGFCDADGNILPRDTKYSKLARVTFLYDAPLHASAIPENSIEKLVCGDYEIFAVANYSPVSEIGGAPAGQTSYEGLADNGNVTDIVNGITGDNFNRETGLAGFKTGNAIFNYRINAVKLDRNGVPVYSTGNRRTEQYIAGIRPQPLSVTDRVTLLPGLTKKGVKLKRTYSRIRIRVDNTSSTDALNINGLSFSPNFASTSIYLIAKEGEDNWVGQDKDSLVVTSSQAVKPYIPQGANHDEVTDIVLAPNTGTVVFDAYILETQDLTTGYTYTLKLEYPGKTRAPEAKLASEIPITTVNAFTASFSNGITDYLIKSARSDFLYENADDVCTDSNLMEIADELKKSDYIHVWHFVKNENGYNISNRKSSAYLYYKPWDLSVNAMQAGVFTLQNYTGNPPGLVMLDFVTRHNMSDYNNHTINGWNKVEHGFEFYPVSINENLPAEYKEPIVLSAIDPVQGRPFKVDAIRRNDFIDVRVDVSYEEKKGWLEFIVKNWERVSGDIEFN